MKLSEKMAQEAVAEEPMEEPVAASGSIAARTRTPRTPGEEREAEPEEGISSQEDYDKVVLAASEIMYGEGMPKVVKMMEGMKDQPDVAIGETAALIIIQLDEKMGGAIADDVMIYAAAEIAEELAALAMAQGLFQVDQKVLQRSAHKMYARLGAEYDIDPQEIQALIADMSDEDIRNIVQGEQALYEGDSASLAQPQQAAAMPAPGGMQNG